MAIVVIILIVIIWYLTDGFSGHPYKTFNTPTNPLATYGPLVPTKPPCDFPFDHCHQGYGYPVCHPGCPDAVTSYGVL